MSMIYLKQHKLKSSAFKQPGQPVPNFTMYMYYYICGFKTLGTKSKLFGNRQQSTEHSFNI